MTKIYNPEDHVGFRKTVTPDLQKWCLEDEDTASVEEQLFGTEIPEKTWTQPDTDVDAWSPPHADSDLENARRTPMTTGYVAANTNMNVGCITFDDYTANPNFFPNPNFTPVQPWTPFTVQPSTTIIVPPEYAPAPAQDVKDTNPKDAVGIKKVSFSTVPQTVIAEVAVGMTEGARKYGRHNWREADARASVYFDATQRHLLKWWEGEDIDPDSGLSHITKAITSLVVLRDAMIMDKWNDDRPPKIPTDFWDSIQAKVDAIFEKYPNCVAPIVEVKKP